MAKAKQMDVDATIRNVKRGLSGLVLTVCLFQLWRLGVLASHFWIPVKLICCTGFIWYSDQFTGFTNRSGAEVSAEGHGCLMLFISWFFLIAIAAQCFGL